MKVHNLWMTPSQSRGQYHWRFGARFSSSDIQPRKVMRLGHTVGWHTQYKACSEGRQVTPENYLPFHTKDCNYLSLCSIILIKHLSCTAVLDVVRHFHLFAIFKAERIMKRVIRPLVLINQSFCHVLTSEPVLLLVRLLLLINSWHQSRSLKSTNNHHLRF